MNNHIFRSYQEPKREGLSWEELWKGSDNGLIACWEVGRELGKKDHELAECAKSGELPVLNWKGGVEKKIQKKEKYGSQKYLAQWQGLRGEDLNIDLSVEQEIVCTRTEMKVIYTADTTKEALIYSVLSFPRRREPSQIKQLDPRLRGDDEIRCGIVPDVHAV